MSTSLATVRGLPVLNPSVGLDAEGTAELTRTLLGDHAPELLEHEDVVDAFGEIANVVGGNVKAVLPGPSVLGLPEESGVLVEGRRATAVG